ncbi:MAG TPA: class I SAM-dependent methyltransferase [Thermoleophilia bacterium]|nr:class I SAM-dependent methyltransferase [Thermoleophilia bacterium]
MKIRQSGMPEETYWRSLFDVAGILDRLGVDRSIGETAEFGCGYGTFSIPVARRIRGCLHTFDVDPDMVARTRTRADEEGLTNLRAEQRDLLEEGFGLAAGSQDACLLFNILHGERPKSLLREARRVLRSSGRLYVVHWRYDPTTPRGPSMDVRPRPEDCVRWAASSGFHPLPPGKIDLPPYHYGLVFVGGEKQV